MRWKRGMFRLWVVISGIWVIGALIIGLDGFRFPKVYGLVVDLHPSSKTYEFTNETVYTWSSSTPDAPAGFERAAYEFEGTTYIFQYPEGSLPSFKGSDWIKSVADDVDDDRKQRLWDARLERILVTAAGALIPPAIVLAIGAALAWAFSGFSRKDGTGNE